MDCWVSHNGSRRAKQCPMEWVLAVRKRSLVALTDPRLVLTTPKDGVIGLPDRLTGVNTTSRKPCGTTGARLDWGSGDGGGMPGRGA